MAVKILREGVIYIGENGQVTIAGWHAHGTLDELKEEVFRRILLAGETIRREVAAVDDEAQRVLMALPPKGGVS